MRTYTAMYESRADAERVQRELETLGIIDVDGMKLHDQGSQDGYSTHESRGFWASMKSMFLPDEDRHTYEEGVRRGHCVLTVEVDDQHADRVHDLLENSNAIDVDERASQWRQEGWTAPSSASTSAQTGMATMPGTNADAIAGATASADTGTEERIPIVEESLAVGKREVARGGVRVRSYVREVPVHEQVRLREEHVDVERRPVNEPLDAANLAGDAFRERTVEATEAAEEAVVAKQARVVEEVVVRKGVEERVERIDDTVRHTEVDVERLADNDRLDRTERFAADRGDIDDGGLGRSGMNRDGLNDPTKRDRLK